MDRPLRVTLGIIVIVMLGFGCGDSGGGEADRATEATQTRAISKARFIKQADEACARVAKKREASAAALRKELDDEFLDEQELSAVFKKIVAPAIEEQVEALEALPAPAQDEAKVSEMIANLAKVGEQISREGTRGTGRREVFDFQREARGYGLKTCTQLF